MRNLNRMTWAFQHPLEYIKGEKCRICGKPATCAVVNFDVRPACTEHGLWGRAHGYDVVFQNEEKAVAK